MFQIIKNYIYHLLLTSTFGENIRMTVQILFENLEILILDFNVRYYLLRYYYFRVINIIAYSFFLYRIAIFCFLHSLYRSVCIYHNQDASRLNNF